MLDYEANNQNSSVGTLFQKLAWGGEVKKLFIGGIYFLFLCVSFLFRLHFNLYNTRIRYEFCKLNKDPF